MVVFYVISGPEYDKNANIHRKSVLLLGKNLFKICYWAKAWYKIYV